MTSLTTMNIFTMSFHLEMLWLFFFPRAFYGADMSTKTQHPLPQRNRKVVTGACLVAASLAAVG